MCTFVAALIALLFVCAPHARAQFTFANDNAGNTPYLDGWASGDNGGTGFGAWTITTTNAAAGVFTGNPTNNGMNNTGIGTPAFGLYSSSSSSGYVNATRGFSNSMGAGDTFSFYWAMNFDGGTASAGKGFDIRSGGTSIFTVLNANNAGISIGGVTPTIFDSTSYGTNAMLVTITKTTTGFTFSMSTRTNSSAVYTTNVTTSSDITGFNLFEGNQTDNLGQRNTYYNNFLSTNSGVFTQGGSVTNANTFSGSGNLSIGNSTTLVLSGSGNNNYTGTTTISNGSTLLFAGSGTSQFASTIGGGTGNLVMSNSAGTVALSSNNTYSGNTTIAAGTLRIGHANALGSTGTITVNTGGRLQLSNGITFTRAITLNGDGVSSSGSLQNFSGDNTWSGTISNASGARINSDTGMLTISGNINSAGNNLYFGGAGNITVGGAIASTLTTGNGALFKDGAGTLTLTNNNSGLTGLVRLLGGTISITNNNSLGSGTLELGGLATQAILAVGTNTSRSQAVLIQDASTNSVINVASGSVFTNSGNVTGGANNATKFGKAGAGTLILAGTASTYGGQIQVGDGTLIIAANNALSTNVTTAQRGVDLGLDISDATTVNNVSVLASNGVTISNSFYVAPNSSSALRTIGISGSGTNTFNNEFFLGGNLTVDAGANATDMVQMSGNIVNTSGLIKTNAGILLLSGSGNTFTGGVTLGSGTLRVANDTALGTGTFTINGGTFASSTNTARIATNLVTMGGNVTFGDASGTGALTLSNINLAQAARTFTVGNNTTVAGVISNGGVTAAGLTKTGAGTLTLSGANTYSGTTTISAGVLTLGASGITNVISGNVVINGGTLNYSGNTNQQITNAANMTISSGAFAVGARNQDLASLNVSGGAITVGSGRLTFTGSATNIGGTFTNTATTTQTGFRFDGGLVVGTGATFVYNNASDGTSASVLRLSNSLTYGSANTTTVWFTNAAAGLGRFNLGGGTAGSVLFDIADSASVANEVNIDWIVDGNSGNTLIKSNTGVLTLTASNAFAGGLTIAGGTVRLGSDLGLGTGTLVLSNGTIASSTNTARTFTNSLNIVGDATFGDTVGTGSLTFSGTGTTNNLSTTRALTTVVDTTIASAFTNTGGITKAGTGTLYLTNANSSFGTLTINAGRVAFQTNATITGLAGSGGNLALSGGTLTVSNSADSTYNNAISGAGVLTKAGAATLILGGANTYSGGTLISAGALQGDSGSLQGTITNNAAIIFTNATNGTYSGVISGSGVLTKNGAGTLTLAGNNSYTNTTTINAGGLALNGGTALQDAAAVSLSNNAGATLIVNASETIGSLRGGGATGGNVNLNGSGVTLTVAETNNNTFAGAITNNGGLTKLGAGTLTLSGANTYSGATTISAGTLALGAANVLSDLTAVTINGGTFDLGANAETIDSITMTSGSLLRGGAGLTLTNASSFTGGTVTISSSTGSGIITTNTLTLGNVTFGYTSISATAKNSALGLNGNLVTTGSGTTFFTNTATGNPFINLNSATRTFTIAAGTALDINWGLRTGGLVKDGTGTLILRSSASSNALSSGVTLSNGVLLLGANQVLGDGFVSLNGGTIASASSTNLTIANTLTNAGDVTFGQVSGGTGSLTFSSTATNNIGGATRTLTTVVDTTIAGALGNGGITKAGSGTLYLSNSSSSFGALSINAGRVTFQTNAIVTGLGEAGGTLDLAGGTLTLNSTTNNTFSQTISGSGGLTKSGSGGTLTLSGANTYSGVTTINGGAISVAAVNGLGANPGVATTNQLTLNGGRLNVTSGFTNNANAGINIGASGGTIDVASGQILEQGGGFYGAGNFTKTGAGVFHLTNSSGSYAGAVTVANGTLQINTTNRGANITLTNATVGGSILKGSGAVGSVTVGDGGAIAPGNSPGTLSVSTTLAFNAGGSYQWEINSTNGPAGTTWDLITVDAGAVGAGDGTLNIGSGGQFTVYGSAIDAFSFNGDQNYTNNYFQIVKASSFGGSGTISNLSFSGSGLGTGSWTFSTNSSGLFLNYTAAGAALVFNNSSAANQGGANIVEGGNAADAYATISDLGGPTVVTISNSAPLIFTNANNSYSGATLIEQGTLVTTADSANNANGAFGNASTAVQVGSLSPGNANDATLLIGAGGVTVGRGVTVNGGGTGVRTIGATNASGVATYSGNVSLNNPVTLSASNSGGTTLFSGIISGASSADTVTIAGNGVVVLSNANTYSNSTLITSGATLRLGNAAALGATATGTTNVSGATLDLNGQTIGSEALSIAGTGVGGNGALINSANTAASWAGTVALTNATTINTTNTSGNITLGGAVSGTGSLTKAGSGTVILSSSNSYSGGTTISAGTLGLGNNSALGSGTLTLGNGATLAASGGSRTVANAAVASGDFTLGGLASSITLSGGLNLGGATRAITLANSATFSGVISNGGLTINNDSSTRNFTMSASNTFTGGVTLNGGNLIFSGSGALVNTSTVVMIGTLSSATLDITNITASSFTIGSLASSNSTSTVNLGTKNLIVGGNNATTTYAGDLNGTGGSLTKAGTGTFTLTKASTYTGGTVLNAGGLALGSSSALGTGTITLNGGAIGSVTSQRTLANNLVAGGDFTFGVGDQSTIFNGTLDLGGSTRTITLENSATLNGIVSNGGITVNNGPVGAIRNLTFGTNNTFAGPLTVNGGTVKLGASGALSSTTAVNLAGSQTNATFDITNSSGAVTIASLAGGTNSAVVLGNNSLTAGGDNTSTTFAGVMSGAGGFTKAGNGAMTLSGANTLSGGLTLSAGTLNLDNASATGSGTFTISGGTINNTSGGAITLSGNNAQSWNGDFTFTGSNDLNLGTGAVTLGASRQLTVSGGALTVGGAISGSTFGLTKLGSGTVILMGANTFTGALNANAGTVVLGSAGRLAAGSSVGIGGGTLNLGGNESVSAFTITSGTLGGSGTLTAPTYTLSGGTLNADLGAGAATAATGTTALNGTLAADLTISGGTVNLGSSDRISDTAAVTLSSGTLGMGTSTDTVGSFTMSGGTLGGTTGVLTASTYALQGGTVNAGLGAGAVTVSTGTTTLGSAGRLNSGSSLTINSGQLTLAGAESVGAVTLTGGTLGGTGNTLTGTSYALQGGTIDANLGGTATATVTTGTTTLNGTLGSTTLNVNSGTLNLGAANRLADTADVTIAGGTLGLGTLSDTVGTFTISSGTLGGSTGVLTASSYALQGGTVNAALGAGAITVSTGTTTLGSAGRLNSASSLTIDSGQLTLGGNEAVAALGGSGGTLALGANSLSTTSANNSIYAGTISGTGGSLTKGGSGTLILSGNNTFTGGTTISNGSTIIAASATALGATNGATTVASGGTLALSNNIAAMEDVNIAGTGVGGLGALRSLSGANTNTGTVTLTADATIAADSGTTLRLGNINNGATSRALTFSNAANSTTLLTGNLSNMDTTTTFYKVGTGSLVISNTSANTGGAQLQLGGGTVTLAAGTYSTNSLTSPRGLDLGLTPGNVNSTNDTAFYVNSGVTMSNTIYVAPAGAGSLGTRTLGTESTSGTATFNGEIYLGGDLVVSAASGGTAQFSGNLINSGNLTKSGSGTVILSGANTATGTVTVGAGTLAITNGAAINNSNSVVISNVAGANFVVNQGETIAGFSGGGATGGTVTLNAQLRSRFDSASNNFAGNITGSGDLLKGGTGTLVLSGSNSFAGGVTNEAGTILIGNNSALGTGTFTVDFGNSTNKTIAANGTGSFTLSQSNNIYNDLTIGQSANNTGKLTFAGGTALGNETGVRFLTVLGTHEFSGGMTGLRGIVKQGTGSLVLSGVNTFTGGVFIDQGAVDLAGGSLAASVIDIGGGTDGSAVTASNALLRVSTNGTFTPSLTINSNAIGGVSGTRTIEFANAGGTATLSGNLSQEKAFTVNVTNAGATGILSGVLSATAGSGGPTITVTGNGTLGVANTGNTTDARWNVSSGATLAIGNSRNLGADPGGYYSDKVTLSGGTLRATNNFSLNSFIGIQVASASTISVDSNIIMTNPAVMGGTGNLTKSGNGTLVLAATNTMTGNVDITAGRLNVTSGSAISDTAAVTVSNGATLGVSALEEIGSLAGAGDVSLTAILIAGGNNTSTTYSGAMRNTGGLVKKGTGTMTLTGVSTNTGETFIVGGKLLYAATQGAIFTNTINIGETNGIVNAALSLTNGITLANPVNVRAGSSNNTLAIESLSTDATNTISGALTLSKGATINSVAGGTLLLSGQVSGSGLLTKTNDGAVALTASNTFTAGVQLNNGTVLIGNNNALGTGTLQVRFNEPGTKTVASAGAGSFTVANRFEVYNDVTIGQTSGGTGSLDFSGAVALGDPVGTTNNRNVTVNGNHAFSGVVSGSNSLTKLGLGTLTLSGASGNTYTGATVVSEGTLELNKTAGLNAINGSITVNSGATLLLSSSDNIANSSAVTLSGGTITRGSGVTEAFSSLNITSASFLDFGTGPATPEAFGLGTYADNATPSALLTINNFLPGNSFTFSSTSFSEGSMSSFFTFGTGFQGYSLTSGSPNSFTITAIPEPSTYLAAAGLLAMFLWPVRRRLIKDARSILGLRAPARDRFESYRNA